MSSDSQLFLKRYSLFTCSIFLTVWEFIADILQSGLLLRRNPCPTHSCCCTKLQPIVLRAMSCHITICHPILLRTYLHLLSPTWWCFPWGAPFAATTVRFNASESLVVPEGFAEQLADGCCCCLAPLSVPWSAKEQKEGQSHDFDPSFKPQGLHFQFLP